jgi:ABC-2 type transport system ATP-binding protein
MDQAIVISNLSKRYGRGANSVTAVANLNLSVPIGQVYGFLGPNGAGKSTTIRLIMGLLRLDQGDIHIFGQSISQGHQALTRVGALIEGATFYNFLTGRKNLELLARTSHSYDREYIETLLTQVGLTQAANRPVGGYSTGMKQRLGVAAALLNRPDLIILDEPTNGLDPSGIQEMRRFIRELATVQGKTVFLSSHLLHEVEQICDRVAIIHRGQLLQEGLVADLLSDQNQLLIETDSPEQAVTLLHDNYELSQNGNWLTVQAARPETPEILRRLLAHDINVFQVQTARQSLEDFFLSVTESGDDTQSVSG